MAYPRPNQDYLLSPDWAENGRSFDIRYHWNTLEPQVVLVAPNEQLEIISLSEAAERGVVSRRTAYHARVVSKLVRRAATLSRQT